MRTHLLDSDRIIDYMNDHGGFRATLAPLIESGVLATTILCLGEIYEGLLGDPAENAKRATLDDLMGAVEILELEDTVARRFAGLRARLRAQGQIIGDHDIWIAATALQHDLTLITRDTHFQRIPMLKIDALAAQ